MLLHTPMKRHWLSRNGIIAVGCGEAQSRTQKACLPRVEAGALPPLRLLRHQHGRPLEVAAQDAQENGGLGIAAPSEPWV